MLISFFTGLFHKRCPLCKQEAHKGGNVAVQRLGKWFCSEQHADLYEMDLYEALQAVHCRHVGCHGRYVPLPEAVSLDCPRRRVPELASGKQAPNGVGRVSPIPPLPPGA
jgi:hypothetical protein